MSGSAEADGPTGRRQNRRQRVLRVPARRQPISKPSSRPAQTPLELAISKLNIEIPDADLSRLLEPILSEVGRLGPIEQDRPSGLIQARCGKVRIRSPRYGSS